MGILEHLTFHRLNPPITVIDLANGHFGCGMGIANIGVQGATSGMISLYRDNDEQGRLYKKQQRKRLILSE